ncbi:MAG TPA: PDZ domain-containing protein [Gemmatimonadaceae bacterium]|nr:PDZ domain-containing protein [Gemmatimonadaceae bacterium]
MKRLVAVGLVAVLISVVAGGQTPVPAPNAGRTGMDSVSAPIRDVHYDVTFLRTNAERRSVDVTMTFATTGSGTVLLSLPAWTPGAYEISNFVRWVSAFDAAGDGRPIIWDKLDYDTWRIRPAGAKSVRISFRYTADTLDNAMAWAKPDFLLFNGTNVFLYAEGQPLEFPATVAVRTEPDWKVTSGMSAGATARSFSATNYHDLVDMPFFVGRYDLDSAQVVNKWVRFATYPAGSIAGPTRQTAWDQIKKVIPPEAAVFGETPWDNYTIMQIVDSAFGGASGLEHQSSHVDVLTPAYVGAEFQPSLYAHEIFHSWNVKRLRPSEMWPYQYSHPQPTPWLWVSEGITDYYADLAEVRGGVVDEKGFYALTAGKITEVMSGMPVSLEDASLNTWVHPVDGTEYVYYPKGSLAGFMLDIIIRDASDNKHSLDDVMRGLYQSTYKHGRSFTSTDWWAAVSAAANGKSFTAFQRRYIDGREPFPLDTVLSLAGMRARQERIPRLGVLTQQDPNGIMVANVGDGTAAAAAGVKVGDYLISVGDIPVEDQQFGARMRAKYGASMEGAPLPIRIRRGTETLTLPGKLQFGAGDYVVEADPAASAKAVRVRSGILKGTTGG